MVKCQNGKYFIAQTPNTKKGERKKTQSRRKKSPKIPSAIFLTVICLTVTSCVQPVQVNGQTTSSVTITAQWQGSGVISNYDTLNITITPTSTASEQVTITDENSNPILVNPPTFGVDSRNPTNTVTVTNLGANVQETGNLLITVTDALGTTLATQEVPYALEPRGVVTTPPQTSTAEQNVSGGSQGLNNLTALTILVIAIVVVIVTTVVYMSDKRKKKTNRYI